jgi:cytochrome c
MFFQLSLRSLRGCIVATGFSLAGIQPAALCVPAAPPDYRFHVDVLAEGMPQPMQLEFAPDGRIFFIEISGKVRIYKQRERAVVDAGTIEVTTAQENGLLGMALDPEFARNGFIYLLHSSKQFVGQTLSRFTMNGDVLDPASRVDLLSYPEQRQECCHHAGSLRFGPDGCLYVGSGDNTNPFADSNGYAPIDERSGRGPWDAQKSAANPNDLRGKILRIKPTPDGKYSIPQGNLFPPGTPGTRPEIYVMGCRNPWRYNFDARTGILYFGDVGPDAGSDDPQRGPRGFDTINQVRAPGNWGWPYARGKRAYIEFDFATKQPGKPYDLAKPVNNSPNNTGAHELPPVQSPMIWYPGGRSAEFPMLAQGGRTACAGPVFHFRPEFKQTSGFPEHYENCLLIYDWSRPFLKWARLDAQSNLVGVEDFPGVVQLVAENQTPANVTGTIVRRPVDAIFGPDGCLYMFDYGSTWGANKDAKLLKVSHQWGNLAPVAKASARNNVGREPLTLELSSAGSLDHDGDPIRYEWRLGEKVFSTESAPKLVLDSPGNYRVDLNVIDAKGARGTASVSAIVGNTPPVVQFLKPADGDFFLPGKPIDYELVVHDTEDGDSSAKGDEFSIRTLVSAAWKKGDAAYGETEIDRGLALMKQSDCFNCHTAEQPLVGPPLVEIAKKYRGQAGALDASVNRVIKGSTGIWGQVPMLPHGQHTADEVHMMVQWIYTLERGKGAPTMLRGLRGQIVAPQKNETTRSCTLDASYTDAGRGAAAPLTGTATIHLRHPCVEAENNDGQSGPQTLGANSAGGKKMLGAIADGQHVRFANVNLAQMSKVIARVASAGAGGRIELRAGSPHGSLLASLDVTPTGGWETWTELTAPIVARAPRSDLYMCFVNPGKGGLMNVDWLQFE